MSTVVVTGAAGRIGSVVCPGLEEAGWTVRWTDLPDADLSDPAAEPVLAALLDGADAVVHLAGIAGEGRVAGRNFTSRLPQIRT